MVAHSGAPKAKDRKASLHVLLAIAAAFLSAHLSASPQSFATGGEAGAACDAASSDVACGREVECDEFGENCSILHHYATYTHTSSNPDIEPVPTSSSRFCGEQSELLGLQGDSADGCSDHEFAAFPDSCPGGLCAPPPDRNAGKQRCDQEAGNPVNLTTGNKIEYVVDYQGAGLFPLKHARAYNSEHGKWTSFASLTIQNTGVVITSFCRVVRLENGRYDFQGCGYGQTLNDNEQTLTFVRPDGETLRYFVRYGWPSSGNNSQVVVKAVRNVNDEVIGWALNLDDGSVEEYDLQGRLQRVTLRSGAQQTYAYNATSGMLASVTDDFGKALVYTFNANGHVTSMTDPYGQVHSYTYDAQDRLTHVTFPDSTTSTSDNPVVQYHYEDTNSPTALTGITDEEGARFATWAYDSSRRATLSEHNGGAERVTFDYSNVDDPLDPRVVTTNALGKTATHHITVAGSKRQVHTTEGHASTNCAAANRSVDYNSHGLATARTDANGTVTNYTYNSRSLEVTRTEAVGLPEERTISTDWHHTHRLPIKVAEPDRIIEFTYDAVGNQLTRTERAAP